MANTEKALQLFLQRNVKTLRPFQEIQLRFCSHFSEVFLSHPQIKQYPEYVKLALWLKPSNLEELKKDFQCYERPNLLLVPRGTAFHLIMHDTDILFIYAWILSLLVGNANIICVPPKLPSGLKLLVDEIQRISNHPTHPLIQETNCLIECSDDEKMAASISQAADIRILWGEEAELLQIQRQYPLPNLAKEIPFPDRYSYALIDASSYLNGDEDEKKLLAQEFYLDAYTYDQKAAPSPRVLFWCGSENEVFQASELFYKNLQTTLLEKKFFLPLNLALQKETYIYNQALKIPIKKIKRLSNELTVIELEKWDPSCRAHQGGGLFYHLRLNMWQEICDFVINKDQTLTYYGLDIHTVQQLASLLNGKGIDRIVPCGQALNFDYFWDGYNLLLELTKNVRY